MKHTLGLKLQRTALLLIGVCVAVNAIISPTVFAIDQNDLNSIINGTPFFDPTAMLCQDSSGQVILKGSDNLEKAYNYLTGQGLSAIAASGIIGNLMVESGVDPKIVQASPPYDSDTMPASIRGKAGYGIAQWTDYGRQQNLLDAAHSAGKLESDLGIQLDFLWKEATTSYAPVLEKLKKATTTDDATLIWMGPNGTGGFENPDPKQAHLDARQANAKAVYEKYGNGIPGGDVCTGSTDYINNFIEYKQCNDAAEHISVPWANAPYDKATVCAAGCGPSAMAMIITNMTGQRVTPDMTAAYGAAHGTAANDGYGGSFWTIADIVGSHWGLKSKEVGFETSDIPAINEALRKGSMILATGAGPLPFSSVGHFIAIRAVTPDGKWLLGNSMVGIGNTINTKYDPTQLTTSTEGHHNAWILSKE